MGRLDRSPRANWVERAGGLPDYIDRIAVHIHEKGAPISVAIATAINAAKKMCATGDLNWPGLQSVNMGSRAEACAAVADWEAKKASAHSMSRTGDCALDLSGTWDSAAHPRVASGPGGGQFTTGGGGGSSSAKSTTGGSGGGPAAAGSGQALWDKMSTMTPAQQQAYLASLSPEQLQSLGASAFAKGQAVAPGMGAARQLVAGELSKRGLVLAPAGKGGKGGGAGKGGGKGAAKAAGKGKGGGAKAHKAAGGKAHKAAAKAHHSKAHAKPAHAPKPPKPPKPTTRPGTVRVSPAVAADLKRKGLLLAAANDRALELAGPSTSTRRAMASRGHALPNGSYPIASKADVRKAVLAFGRAKPEDQAAVKKHIIKRARALGAADLIPKDWLSST